MIPAVPLQEFVRLFYPTANDRFCPCVVDEFPSEDVVKLRQELLRRLKSVADQYPDAEAFVLFENLQMDSRDFGARTACIVGPGCSIESLIGCEGRYLGDLPSKRLYPRCCVLIPELNHSTLVHS